MTAINHAEHFNRSEPLGRWPKVEKQTSLTGTKVHALNTQPQLRSFATLFPLTTNFSPLKGFRHCSSQKVAINSLSKCVLVSFGDTVPDELDREIRSYGLYNHDEDLRLNFCVEEEVNRFQE